MHDLTRMLSGVLVFALGSAVYASAQEAPTLGELARREQERRKAIKTAGKVITNKDLPPSAQRPMPTTPGDPGTAAAAEGEKKPAEQPAAEAAKAGDGRDEGWWRKRMSDTREALRRNEAFFDALQSRVNALSTDFVSRDDPFQRAKIGEDRQKALAEMERVKAEIALAKKLVDDIEEEARKAGVPPGWLR